MAAMPHLSTNYRDAHQRALTRAAWMQRHDWLPPPPPCPTDHPFLTASVTSHRFDSFLGHVAHFRLLQEDLNDSISRCLKASFREVTLFPDKQSDASRKPVTLETV